MSSSKPSNPHQEVFQGNGHSKQNRLRSTVPAGPGVSSLTNDVMSPDDIIIAVMGMTGSGKTTFISRCIGEDVGIGHGLHSFTQDVSIHSFRRNGRTIRLIDTPGFDDTTKSDVHILNNIAFWMSHAYRAEPKLLLSGIIYLHPISEPKMVGTAIKNLTMMKLLCGEGNLGVVWLTTTMWGRSSLEHELAREQELTSTGEFWGGLIQRGSKVCRHHDSEASAFAIVDQIIERHQLVALSIQRQMVDEHREVDQTDAGRNLRRNVIHEQEKVQGRLARSARELEEKLEAQETAEAEEVLERQRGYQHKLQEKTKSLEAMKINMEKLREQKAHELAEREKEFAREKAVQDSKIAELDKQIRELQVQRDDADKRAHAESEARHKLEDSKLQLLMERDLAVIADIDRAIADRKREEEQVQHERQHIVKHESVFRHTMKVSMAETLVHGAMHFIGHAATAVCVVM